MSQITPRKLEGIINKIDLEGVIRDKFHKGIGESVVINNISPKKNGSLKISYKHYRLSFYQDSYCIVLKPEEVKKFYKE